MSSGWNSHSRMEYRRRSGSGAVVRTSSASTSLCSDALYTSQHTDARTVRCEGMFSRRVMIWIFSRSVLNAGCVSSSAYASPHTPTLTIEYTGTHTAASSTRLASAVSSSAVISLFCFLLMASRLTRPYA